MQEWRMNWPDLSIHLHYTQASGDKLSRPCFFTPKSSLWPRGICILHSTCRQAMWPSQGRPWRAPQHVPSFYLCSPFCHHSGSPASARTASPGSHLTCLETAVQRCSGPGIHAPSTLQSPAAAATQTQDTTSESAAPRPAWQTSRRKARKPEAKGRDSAPPLGVCPLMLLRHFLSFCRPALQNHGSSHLLFLFENMDYPPVNGSFLT